MVVRPATPAARRAPAVLVCAPGSYMSQVSTLWSSRSWRSWRQRWRRVRRDTTTVIPQEDTPGRGSRRLPGPQHPRTR
jgi:hypothetical protein